MGRIITPTYRVEYRDNVKPRTVNFIPTKWDSMAWDCKRYGKPTEKNLEKWRQKYNESFQPNGCNWHVSQAAGVVLHITHAKIIHQASNQEVAYTSMPTFEVV